MIESSTNFAAGLTAAYRQLEAEGKLTDKDQKVVGALIRQPVMLNADGKPVLAMKRAHYAIRRHYFRTTGQRPAVRLDWNALVAWIKEHWLDILKIILAILPFLI